jgi:perosamine synthetase
LVNWKIPHYKILVDQDDVQSVSDVIKRKMLWAIGPEIKKFESMLASYVGTKYCLTFNSGTSALHASLIALKIKEKQEVLVPSFTFIATANSVRMVNAIPKFIDIEKETLGIDPILIEKNISKKTKAIIPIHFAGIPCKINEIQSIAKKKKIPIIEDAAEGLGSKINNKKLGTFGDVSVFSFAGNKILTTGEGGAIVTDSKKIFERLQLIRSHGRVEVKNYFSTNDKPNYVDLGYNWRMSSITAALAISQLSKLDKLISMRRKNSQYLSSKLSKIKGIFTPLESKDQFFNYQFYFIMLDSMKKRNSLMKFLTKKGIMSKVFFYPVHRTKFYSNINTKNLKVTDKISQQILSLPMYPDLTKEELNYIVDSIAEFMETS